jgi:hypothetical protein
MLLLQFKTKIRKAYLFFFFQFMFTGAFSQTTYTIPWATQQPKFVFPIYFEEGTGKKDTIYLGYDPHASLASFNPADSIYGVKKIPIDTNGFFVQWGTDPNCAGPTVLCTEVYKANVVDCFFSDPFPNGNYISCLKGVLPLKISWDKNLFYSDSLIYPNNPPLPIAQGRLYFGHDHCKIRENFITAFDVNGDIIISDTSGNVKDSAVIYNIFNQPGPTNSALTFQLEPWGRFTGSVNNLYSESNYFEISIHQNEINIHNERNDAYFEIYDLSGKRVLFQHLHIDEQTNLKLEDVGFFILKIFNSKYCKQFKFINY